MIIDCTNDKYISTTSFGTAPPISVKINGSIASPTAGERYSLACNVFGASASKYEWRMNDSVIQDETSMMLSWPMFHLSNAGVYSCTITVDMMTYTDNKTVTLKSKH